MPCEFLQYCGIEEKPEIIIDLEESQNSLPVLTAHSSESSYESYLTVLPGVV